MRAVLAMVLFPCLATAAAGAEAGTVPRRLAIGVVQMSMGPTLADNRDRIVSWVAKAAARGARVVVFPEGALRGRDSDNRVLVDEATAAIRRAAREHRAYVVCGVATRLPRAERHANSMFVAGPDGREVFRYDKLYDTHDAQMPGVFYLDGVPCGAMICADRWLRGVEEIPIQQGAQISFELSCNFASEWVEPFGWYWYVPRAVRNSVWVVFANAGNKVSGVPDDPSQPRELRHGHSAILAPDGSIAAAARDDVEALVVAEVDVRQATRRAALARAAHPALRPFWEAGLKLHSGQAVAAPALAPWDCPATDITLAAAQVTGRGGAIEEAIGRASQRGADLVALPERAIAEAELPRLEAAARRHRITVVAGMEHAGPSGRSNSAFVIGPDGSLLTRYDQLSASDPYVAGVNPAAMWFRVKGVPAVVTVGRDALWTELAEWAAVAGAQIHVHLDHDPASGAEAGLRRLQVWSNLASFQTFSVAANVVGSTIWDDLRDAAERRAEVRGLPRPDTGKVQVYSPFSANLVVQAGPGEQLITATRRVGPRNEYHPRRTSNFNPQMDAWYRTGAAILRPGKAEKPVFPGKEWAQASPESQGVDAAKLQAAIEYLDRGLREHGGTGTLFIARHGYAIWAGPECDREHQIFSATKSFTSTVLGLLIDDGKVSLGTLAKDLDPALAEHYPAVTLRHFATMTSGYDSLGGRYEFDTQRRGDSWNPGPPGPPLFPPGSKFRYWDDAMSQFGSLLTKAAGEPLDQLFRRRIADPIGMTRWRWTENDSPVGRVLSWAGGIHTSSRELARFGHLFLNRGNWNGRQLVSAAWVEQATSVQVPASVPNDDLPRSRGAGVYGYNWWVNGVKPDGRRLWPGAPPRTFYANGLHDNVCIVVPEWNMVLARTNGARKGRGENSPPNVDELWSGFFARMAKAVAP